MKETTGQETRPEPRRGKAAIAVGKRSGSAWRARQQRTEVSGGEIKGKAATSNDERRRAAAKRRRVAASGGKGSKQSRVVDS